MIKIFLAALAALCVATAVSASSATQHPGAPNCTVKWTTQPLDHFGWRTDTFKQRYLVYDGFLNRDRLAGSSAEKAPMLFYVGNEANVELFANWTGWMWENGPKLNALLVFAEHRFFGKSMPCEGGFQQCGDYLGTDQALADYAHLIRRIRDCPECPEYIPNIGAVVSLGGSYGGMLSYYIRARYPKMVAGALACSAPIGCIEDDYDQDSYWRVITHDATAAGGSAPGCHVAVHGALSTAMGLLSSGSAAEQQQVVDAFKLCSKPKTAADLGYFVQAQFDSAGMGSYPFETYYIAGVPGHPAPPYPMRIMCASIMEQPLPRGKFAQMQRLAESLRFIANLTQDVKCYDVNNVGKSVTSPTWDFMVCSERMINEIPYFSARGPPHDMFWKQPGPWNQSMFNAHCMAKYNKKPRWNHWATGLDVGSIKFHSNIIFTNGLLDPWSSGGVTWNVTGGARDVTSYLISNAGHHLDLFFPTPEDEKFTPEVIFVRAQQLAAVKRWIAQYDTEQREEKKKSSRIILGDL